MGTLKTAVVTLSIMVGIAGLAAAGAEVKTLEFDRAALHAQAVEESLKPVHPGVPGKRPFWNFKAGAFIYAPAFDFGPVKGAVSYRFTVLAYGTKRWSFDSTDAKTSLEPVWKNLPEGKLLVEVVPLDDKGNARWARGDLKLGLWVTKDGAGGSAAPLDFNALFTGRLEKLKNRKKYRFTVWAAKELAFEAGEPWAPLSPVWKDVPVGAVVLRVEGLDGKGGKPVGAARMRAKHRAPRTSRRFRRKAVFNGPYHEAASDYTDSVYRWLKWLAKAGFKGWKTEKGRAGQYPCKFVGHAISGLTALATLEKDPAEKKEALRMAGNAARRLIKMSFPADHALAHLPPTYSGKGSGTVMMNYPPWSAGSGYLDYYEASGDKAALEAARKIADTYMKTQLPNGTWYHLVEAKTGEVSPRSNSYMMPVLLINFLERLIDRHGFKEYRPMAEKAWRWIEEDPLKKFRFEGQFEDQGSSGWNLSSKPACLIAERLFKNSKENPSYIALGEEALRFAEDQFVVWEQKHTASSQDRSMFTPCGLEQYKYMVSISATAAMFIRGYQAAYEATGRDLYLAKAVAFANAMTVLQRASVGDGVPTFWYVSKRGGVGGWTNCHEYSARMLLRLARMLEKRNLRVAVNANAGTEAKQ